VTRSGDWQSTPLAQRLGLAAPIVQGPFGSGLSSVELVAAVSEAGGLGSFGVHHLGAAEIREVAAAIRARTSRPFALNLWIPFENSEVPQLSDHSFQHAVERLQPYYEELGVPMPSRPTCFTPPFAEQIEAVLEARPAVFSFVFGVPEPAMLARCAELGIMTVGTATSVDEAQALEDAGVSAVVASGFEAGGHRISFLRAAEESLIGTLSLVPAVVDAVGIPVIAAGGIGDGRGVAAALCLGAQAVQIGTAFLACDESAAPAIHREALRSPRARDTALTRAFTGRLARGIRNRFIETMRTHERELPPYPVQAWLTGCYKQSAIERERSDVLPLWAGQSAGLIRHRNARELFAALLHETDDVFGR
jgi:nitronate monooxygenase